MRVKIFFTLANLLIWCHTLPGQTLQDTLQTNDNPESYGGISVEETWQMQKSAYQKQLRSKGLSEQEVKSRMEVYESDKDYHVQRIIAQWKFAEQQKALAESQRLHAIQQRKLAEMYRKEAEKHRELDSLEKRKAREAKRQSDINRKRDVEIAEAYQQRAQKERELAEVQRQKALRERELAETARRKAMKQSMMVREFGKSRQEIISRNIKFMAENPGSRQIGMEVREGGALQLNINGYLKSGTVNVQILDPDGKTTHSYMLVSGDEDQSGDPSAWTSGSFNHTINQPELGDWKLIISPENAEGNIDISVAQYLDHIEKR